MVKGRWIGIAAAALVAAGPGIAQARAQSKAPARPVAAKPAVTPAARADTGAGPMALGHPDNGLPVEAPQVVRTMHRGTFGGVTMEYEAVVAETILRAPDGTQRAAIVTTSYVRQPRDPSRPVAFFYNGGPGSGSLWLHMGAFGPKRVDIPGDAKDDGGPPYPILDNPDALLDVADLVFIDPVGTGWSRALGKTDPKEFWGVTKDARALAEVIRRWLGDNGRWNSPKYIGGESYGTTRSAALVNELEGSYNDIALNGVILVSTILDFSAETDANDQSYILSLPSMAVTALYHGKAQGASASAVAAQARAFASGPYASWLYKGVNATAAETAAVRATMSRLTGLSEAFLDRANLRVSTDRFYKELLRDRKLTVGRLDARYTGRDLDSAGEGVDNDPSFYGIDGGYGTAVNSWMRDGLGWKTERAYRAMGNVQPWDWNIGGERGGNAYLNVAPYLSKAMRENRSLRIFNAQGWYDFATPFYGAEYSLTRPGFDQSRITYRYYDAGHMMYVRAEDRAALSADIRAFIRAR